MRKSTINLILGILIGLIISQVSDINYPTKPKTSIDKHIATPTPISTQSISYPFEQQIAPGLQIIEVPPPLDILGSNPYQCYMNGELIKIPKEIVKQLVADHGNPTDNDPNFNIHNFTGNLKMVDVPVGSVVSPSPLSSNNHTR